MAYSHWQAGLHFQQASIVCVAVQKTRSGRALRRWWQLPMETDASEQHLIAALRRIQREMPRFHRLVAAIPAADTLQRQLPPPQMILRESETAQWVASTVAKQLEMPSETLAFDYHTADNKSYSVTAVRRRDVELLQQRLHAAGLNLCAIAPDASALQNFLPWIAKEVPGVCWQDRQQWLWATREAWGCSADAPADMLVCTTQPESGLSFNPWFPLNQLQPPLPQQGDAFAIALALALGVA
ncbi:pilus assembly protein [Scandinavium sp. V105_16]|uniref:Pilus assembly protein n=1 Tax=Scandinavium lactucae TaxID=3095028 RepID=A0AAJ2VR02_9ENTR|nr:MULTISPECIES: pilus assembly protein [unclassified Scandinavium]MDX6019444.1 pilus assembly protein [Scandinavium sp. V105_16]MDX6030400.1 pilus assembly protein [Scandinavium sp. V105_12]